MSALDLDAIEARANAATLGPWIAYRPHEHPHDYRIATMSAEMNRNREWYVCRLTRSHENEAHPSAYDAAFIAAARADVPALVALARTQAAEIATHRAADDPLLDGTDGAHPAWWRGHERAAEMLTAQRDAALADAASLRAAAVKYLALRDAVAAHDTSSRPFTDYAEFVLAIDKLTAARDALRAAIGGAP